MPRGPTSTKQPVHSLAFWDGTTDSYQRCCCPSPCKVHYPTDPLPGVTTSEVDDATKLLEKARQKLQGIQNIPSQRVNDLEAAIRQLRQICCILDSCTISASYEVTQAQKAILQLHHTARGARTSSEELNAQTSPRTDDEYNLPYHEDELQEH